jgi:hypothetical protein
MPVTKQGILRDTDPDRPDFGPCCSCQREGWLVRNIINLDERAPQLPGTVWGCLQCGVPSVGATAVICDACLETEAPIRFVVAGWLEEKDRAVRASDAEPFTHDWTKHPELGA